MSKPQNPATVEQSLRIAHGATPDERAHIVEVFGKLESRLKSFPAGDVDLQLSIKERDTVSQKTTLEAIIARRDPLVARSDSESFDGALVEVRDELIRQITDMKNREEPRNNKHLRERTD